MAIENPPFQYAFPIEHGDFPSQSCAIRFWDPEILKVSFCSPRIADATSIQRVTSTNEILRSMKRSAPLRLKSA